jgi:hypothetical protein
MPLVSMSLQQEGDTGEQADPENKTSPAGHPAVPDPSAAARADEEIFLSKRRGWQSLASGISLLKTEWSIPRDDQGTEHAASPTRDRFHNDST